jgi:hypothetical protein
VTQAAPLRTCIRKIPGQVLRDFTYPHALNTGTVKLYLKHFLLNAFSSLFTLTQLFRFVFYSDLRVLTPGRCGVRIPVQVRDYFRFKTSRPSLGPTQPLIQWLLVLFPGAKRPECESDHPPLSGAEVKNEWSYTSTPPIYLHGVERENVAFAFTNTRTIIRSFILFTLNISG